MAGVRRLSFDVSATSSLRSLFSPKIIGVGDVSKGRREVLRSQLVDESRKLVSTTFGFFAPERPKIMAIVSAPEGSHGATRPCG